jgi:hypothetical protein
MAPQFCVLKRLGASYNAGMGEYSAYLAVLLLLSWFTYRYIEFGKEHNIWKLLPIMENKS